MIPNIQRLLSCFRETGSPIFFTAMGSDKGDGSDLPFWMSSQDDVGLATLGSRIIPPVGDVSWEIDKAVRPGPGEPVLNKRSAGTFATANLEQRLRDRSVESVLVTGLTTDVCVSTTAREAADRNFNVVVVSDACTTLSEQLHHANLETLHVFGWVRTANEVIEVARGAVRAV